MNEISTTFICQEVDGMDGGCTMYLLYLLYYHTREQGSTLTKCLGRLILPNSLLNWTLYIYGTLCCIYCICSSWAYYQTILLMNISEMFKHPYDAPQFSYLTWLHHSSGPLCTPWIITIHIDKLSVVTYSMSSPNFGLSRYIINHIKWKAPVWVCSYFC